MPCATPDCKTRILIDRSALHETMTMNVLERSLRDAGIEAEVFAMATNIGIDIRTLDMLAAATLLKEIGII